MRFTAMTAKEIQESKLLPKGQYLAEVIDAEDAVGKNSGKEQIKLSLRIYDSQDRTYFVTDYLLEAMQFKLLHFCEAAGIKEQYEIGSLSAMHCLGKKVPVDIDVKTDSFGTKNTVKDYVTKKENDLPLEAKKDEFIDDSIPF